MSDPKPADIVWIEMGFPREMVNTIVNKLGMYTGEEEEETAIFTMFVRNAVKLAVRVLLQDEGKVDFGTGVN